MNTLELNGAMARKAMTADRMADVIRKSRVTFNRKRYGDVAFDPSEILAIAEALDLTVEQVNVIFFDGKLPKGN